jgi:2,3-bisphosphoglycerate-independent phosphoglycerate mutase
VLVEILSELFGLDVLKSRIGRGWFVNVGTGVEDGVI